MKEKKRLSKNDFHRIERWMRRNARPLEFALWNFHFDHGNKKNVLDALSAFQNEDGGFGHALEADSHNPLSSPLQTADAIEIIESIGGCSAETPMIQGILGYLQSGKDFHDGRWDLIVASNDAYPHAPWWNTKSDSEKRSTFNPTAILCGFGLKYAQKDTDFWKRCLKIARNLIDKHLNQSDVEMHPLLCLVYLYTILLMLDPKDDLYLRAYAQLITDEKKVILDDLESRESYKCFPTHFIRSTQHPLYETMRGLVDEDLDRILTQINDEGLWDLNWGWGNYPEAFAVSTLWWKARIAFRNCVLLDNFNRIEGR